MKPALVLIDLQGDFLASCGMEPAAGPLIARAMALLEGCRQRRIPIIHVWTTIHRDDDRRLPHWKQNDRWLCVAGTAGHQPPAQLRALDGETIVHKAGFNAFAGGERTSYLAWVTAILKCCGFRYKNHNCLWLPGKISAILVAHGDRRNIIHDPLVTAHP